MSLNELWNGQYSALMEDYFKDDAKKLTKMVDKIFRKKYGGISEYDMPEFYSVAIDVCVDIVQHDRYDKTKGSFAGFLHGALDCAIIDEFKKQTRDKRITKVILTDEETGMPIIDKKTGKPKRVAVQNISLDAPIKTGEKDNGSTWGDILPNDFDLEEEAFKESNDKYSNKMLQYLAKLSHTQKNILRLTIAGYSPHEIREELHITERQYADCNAAIHSYRNVSILF